MPTRSVGAGFDPAGRDVAELDRRTPDGRQRRLSGLEAPRVTVRTDQLERDGSVHLGVAASERVGERPPRKPGDVAQPIGRRGLDAERGRDVAGVDPALRESRRRKGLQRQLARHPRHPSVRVAGPERGAHLLRGGVPAAADRVAARLSFRVHLRGGGIVDGNSLGIAATEKAVAVAVEIALGAGGGELVGRGEVHEHRGDVPALTAGRSSPIVARALVDDLGELRMLGRQRDEDVVHGVRIRLARR